jgi:hypothetical protein
MIILHNRRCGVFLTARLLTGRGADAVGAGDPGVLVGALAASAVTAYGGW